MRIRDRIINVAIAVILILAILIQVLVPGLGYSIVVLILCASLLIYGIRQLIYYFTMARHMVDGKKILYLGILIVDAGLFTLSLSNVPPLYIMLYLIAVYAFAGVMRILRALEEKKMGSPAFKWTLLNGILHILIAALCAVFIRSADIAVYIYGAGLFISAIMRLVKAFRKNEVLYISP